MPLETLSLVRLVTDRHQDRGVAHGALGVVLDAYHDGYEVEFSRADGSTIAWFAVGRDEVEPVAGAAASAAHRPG